MCTLWQAHKFKMGVVSHIKFLATSNVGIWGYSSKTNQIRIVDLSNETRVNRYGAERSLIVLDMGSFNRLYYRYGTSIQDTM